MSDETQSENANTAAAAVAPQPSDPPTGPAPVRLGRRLRQLPAAYRAALRTACAAALDAGMSYDLDFDAFVFPCIADADPAVDRCLGVFEPPADFAARRAWDRNLSLLIAASPRGTWLILHHCNPDEDREWFNPLMSDGTGEPRWNSDTYDEPPTFDAVYRRMAGFEIYLIRHEVEAERGRVRDLALIAERGFRIGSTFRNLRFGLDRFSTAIIVEQRSPCAELMETPGANDLDEGRLTLLLTKRGSRKRYRCRLKARSLASAIDEAAIAKPVQSAPGTWIV